MAKVFNRAIKLGGEPRVVGTPAITVELYDVDANVRLSKGATVPTDTDSGYAKGCLFVQTDGGVGTTLYINEGSTTSADFNAVSAGGSATAYDDIGDPDANGSIAMGVYTGTYTSSTASWGGIIISNSNSDPTAGANLLSLNYVADGDAQGVYLVCKDNSSADTKFQIAANGATTIAGSAAGTDALTITNGDVTLASGHVVLTSGNLTLTLGNLTLTSSNIVHTSGDYTLEDGGIKISSDNEQLTLGESDATDSYLKFDGSALVFYDSSYGAEITLTQLTSIAPNPTIAGDVTISDGKLTWTDLVDEQAGAWIFSNTASNDVLWTSATTIGNALKIVANSVTSGSLVYLESSAAGFIGEYINCYDGAASDFTVGLYGATIIAGNASTDVLTVTVGDVQITAGDIDVDLGIITVDNTADEANYIKRNFNGVGTGAVLTVESTHASGTNNSLAVVQSGTGAATAMNIDSEGTADTLTITGKATSASLIKATGEVATGTIFEAISAASATVSAMTFTNLGTGATGWLGADGVGMLNVTCDGNLAHANASCLNITYSGTGAASGMGTSLRIVDTGATATSYAAYISAATGEALKVDTGTVQFDEALTLGIDDIGADLKIFGATSGKYVEWDESADSLFLTNSTVLRIGGTETPDGVTIDFDGADLDIDAVTANDNIKFGSDIDTNVIFTMTASSLTLDHGVSSVVLAAGGYLSCVGSGTGKGLVIPSHTIASPSQQDVAGAGNIFFEVDANKLWVYNGTGWVGTVLA